VRIKALIFDVDGTLADTEEAHRRAFNAAFAQQGLDWNWSKRRYAKLLATAGGKERLAAFIDSLGLPPPLQRQLAARIETLHAAKTAFYTSLVKGGEVPLRDGVSRLLEEAEQAGVRLAIASTTTLANIEALLCTHLGARALERFAVIGAAEHARRKKPAPDIYRFVLHELGAAARECVAIEDSAMGLAAAKGADLFTVVTPSYWTRGEDFAAADLLLPSLGTALRPIAQRHDAAAGGA
jgi:HAD superfamily hydrolase (TIGR01509 family)